MPLTNPEEYPQDPTEGAIVEEDANNMRKEGKPERIKDGIKKEVNLVKKIVIDEIETYPLMPELLTISFGILYVIGLYGNHEPDFLWLPMYISLLLVCVKNLRKK